MSIGGNSLGDRIVALAQRGTVLLFDSEREQLLQQRPVRSRGSFLGVQCGFLTEALGYEVYRGNGLDRRCLLSVVDHRAKGLEVMTMRLRRRGGNR